MLKAPIILGCFDFAKSLPEPKFIMKSELSWIPILSTYARKIGCVTVKRNDRTRSWHALKEAIRKEAQNQSGSW